MTALIRIHHYRGNRPQRLRNVPVYTPSIFAVQTGHKILKWHHSNVTFHHNNWLMTPSNQSLTFINEPAQTRFLSTQMAFLSPPDEHLIKTAPGTKAKPDNNRQATPSFTPSQSLQSLWQQMQTLPNLQFSETVQQHLLQGFYQQLWEEGGLPLLFPNTDITMKEKVSRYLANEPAKSHTLDSCSQYLGVSKATLARHLAKEDTSFRDVLSRVRMTHSLSLMQQYPYKLLELALLCGYQSESRFSQRFRQQFGISPRQYLKTLV